MKKTQKKTQTEEQKKTQTEEKVSAFCPNNLCVILASYTACAILVGFMDATFFAARRYTRQTEG